MSDVLTRLAVEITGNVDAFKRELDARGIPALENFMRKAEQASARATKAAGDGVGAITRRIQLLERGTQVESTRAASLRKLDGVEKGITTALTRNNLTLEQRVRLEEQLARVQAIRNPVDPESVRSLNDVAAAAKKATFSLGDLVPAFNGLAARAVGVDSVMGTLAGTIGSIGSAEVTGVVLAGAAIIGGAYELITRKARAAKAAAAETRKELEELQNRGDVEALTARAKTLFEGTAAKGFGDGIRAIEAAIAEEQRKLDEAVRERNVVAFNEARATIARLNATLKPLRDEFDDIERRIRAPGPTEARTRDPVKVTAEAPDAVRKQAEKATSALAEFLQETARQVAKSSGDMVDQLDQQLAELDAKAAKLHATQEAGYLAARAALVQQKADAEAAQRIAAEEEDRAARRRQEEEANRLLTAATVGRITDEFNTLLTSAEALNLGLIGLSDEQVTALGEWEDALKQLAPQSKEAAALLERIQKARAENRGSDGKDTTTPSAKPAHDWATEITRGARALLDAASAAGVLDQTLASALNSAVNLAESLGDIFKNGVGVTNVTGAVAAVANIILSQRAAEQRRQQTDDANRRAIEGLARAVGDLAGLSVSGGTFSRVRTAVGGAVATFNTGFESPIGDATRFKNAAEFFAAAGVSLDDVEAVAKSLGITLDGTAGSFRKLDEAIKAADFAALTDTFAGAMTQLDALLDVDNVDSPLGQLLAFATSAGAHSAVFAALAGQDLSTAAGRTAARGSARTILDDFLAGRLDPSALGDLSPQEFLDAIRRFINGIDAVEQGIADAAQQAEADAAAMGEVTRRQLDDAARAEAEARAARAQAEEDARGRLVSDTLGRGQARSALRDADAVGQLRDLADAYAALSPAIAGLVQGLDLSTADGVAALDRAIRDLFDGLEGGTVVANLGTLTVDELRDALLTLESAGDSAAESITQAAQALADAAHAAVQTRLQLLATRNGALGIDPSLSFDQALALGRKDPLISQFLDGVTTAGGAQDAFTQFLTSVFDPARLDQATPEQLAQSQAALASFQQLLGFVPTGALPIPADVRPGGGAQSISADVANVTETTANTLVDIDRAGVSLLQTLVGIETSALGRLDEMAAALRAPTGPLVPPQIPGFGTGALGALRAGAGAGDAGPLAIAVDIANLALSVPPEGLAAVTDKQSLLALLATLTGAELARVLGDALPDAIRRALVGRLPSALRAS